MRTRYAKMMGRRDVVLIDAPFFLIGLYCVISPWVVDFATSQAALATHNLIMGVAIGLLALGFTVAPERMYGMSWAMSAIGLWLVISPWMVGTDPTVGVIWNNIIVGALAFLLGLVAARQVMSHRERNATGSDE